MLYESAVELGSLREHVLELLLGHKSHVNSLHELLPSGVNLYGVFELFELVPGLSDSGVRGFDQVVLLAK